MHVLYQGGQSGQKWRGMTRPGVDTLNGWSVSDRVSSCCLLVWANIERARRALSVGRLVDERDGLKAPSPLSTGMLLSTVRVGGHGKRLMFCSQPSATRDERGLAVCRVRGVFVLPFSGCYTVATVNLQLESKSGLLNLAGGWF